MSLYHFPFYDVYRVCNAAFKRHLNLLMCWHGFRDVNVAVNVGIRWRRQSCFCGCLVNVTICNTTYDWPTNHSPPNIIHDQLLI